MGLPGVETKFPALRSQRLECDVVSSATLQVRENLCCEKLVCAQRLSCVQPADLQQGFVARALPTAVTLDATSVELGLTAHCVRHTSMLELTIDACALEQQLSTIGVTFDLQHQGYNVKLLAGELVSHTDCHGLERFAPVRCVPSSSASCRIIAASDTALSQSKLKFILPFVWEPLDTA